MSTSYAKPDTLIAAALAPLDWTRAVSLVVAFSLLTALAAQIVIPIGPVPITGQTFAVLLTGALLGSRLGAMAMIVYLIEGASGLPFFYGGTSGIRPPPRAHRWIPDCFSRRCVHYRRLCRARLGQALSDSRRVDGDWLSCDYAFRLGLVCSDHKHTTPSCFSTYRAEIYSRRHHQDPARCRGAAVGLGAVEAPRVAREVGISYSSLTQRSHDQLRPQQAGLQQRLFKRRIQI